MTDLRAYSVLEKDEWTGGVVFATRKDQAIRKATRRFFDDEEPETACSRAPWADRYAGSAVPAAEMVRHGWRFECSGCLRTIDEDMRDLDGDPEEATDGLYEGWTPDAVVGTQDSEIYCTARCETDHRTRQATRRRLRDRAVARFTRILLARLPDAQPVDAGGYLGRPDANFDQEGPVPLLTAIRIPFAYPGARHGHASLEYAPRGTKPEKRIVYMCPQGDVAAFEAYLSTHDRGPTHDR